MIPGAMVHRMKPACARARARGRGNVAATGHGRATALATPRVQCGSIRAAIVHAHLAIRRWEGGRASPCYWLLRTGGSLDVDAVWTWRGGLRIEG